MEKVQNKIHAFLPLALDISSVGHEINLEENVQLKTVVLFSFARTTIRCYTLPNRNIFFLKKGFFSAKKEVMMNINQAL